MISFPNLKGIAKLPFIDEARLLAEVAKIEHTLTVSDNIYGNMILDYINGNMTLGPPPI